MYIHEVIGQSSCSGFVSLIFSIFSCHLSLAPCIKTHTKTQEMAIKRPYFQNFSEEHSLGPLQAGASQANSCSPPQNF